MALTAALFLIEDEVKTALVKKKKAKAKKTKKPTDKDRRQSDEISDEARTFALAAAKLAAERHCSDIVVLDLRGISPATDYFVIATGTSERQMRTVADEVSDFARKQGMQRFGRAGYEQARWILLDYVDVVIHVFDEQYREYFDLELLWGDAKRLTIDYNLATEDTEFTENVR